MAAAAASDGVVRLDPVAAAGAGRLIPPALEPDGWRQRTGDSRIEGANVTGEPRPGSEGRRPGLQGQGEVGGVAGGRSGGGAAGWPTPIGAHRDATGRDAQ